MDRIESATLSHERDQLSEVEHEILASILVQVALAACMQKEQSCMFLTRMHECRVYDGDS